jgi:hypothetical protein
MDDGRGENAAAQDETDYCVGSNSSAYVEGEEAAGVHPVDRSNRALHVNAL